MLQQHDFASLTHVVCALVLGYWVCVAIYRGRAPLMSFGDSEYAVITLFSYSVYLTAFTNARR
jgi:hypothetical protein